MGFKNEVLREYLYLERQEVKVRQRKLHSEELHSLYC
jgi:hypothetical protein